MNALADDQGKGTFPGVDEFDGNEIGRRQKAMVTAFLSGKEFTPDLFHDPLVHLTLDPNQAFTVINAISRALGFGARGNGLAENGWMVTEGRGLDFRSMASGASAADNSLHMENVAEKLREAGKPVVLTFNMAGVQKLVEAGVDNPVLNAAMGKSKSAALAVLDRK